MHSTTTRRLRRFGTAAAVIAAVLTTASCSSGSSGHGAPELPAQLVGQQSTPAQNEALVRGLYADVFTAHQLDKVTDYLRLDYIQHTPSVPWGVDGFNLFYRDTFFKTFPDISAKLEVVVPTADRVFSVATWRGHAAKDGKAFTLRTADMYRVSGGKLAEHWDAIDYSKLTAFGFKPPTAQEPSAQPAPPATADDRAAVEAFKSYLDKAIAGHDASAVSAFFAAGYTEHESGVQPGAAGVQARVTKLLQQMPDAAVTVQQVVAHDGYVAGLWVLHGHVSGKPVSVASGDVYRLSGGRFVEHWNVHDLGADATVAVP